MSDAEPKSTSTMSRDLENANSQPSPVAVSEENLAALLRATISSAEPEAERLAEGAPAASVSDVNESSAGAREPSADRPAAVTNPPANIVESRLALFAAVKENRSAISRSGLTPATPLTRPVSDWEREHYHSSGRAIREPYCESSAQRRPHPDMLPETVPLMPAPVASTSTPSWTAD